MTAPPVLLAAKWRRKAGVLREYGDERGALICERHAGQLEEAWREHQLEPLTVQQASELSGYSASHLYHALQDGTLPNSGQKGRPRVLRAHLPRRPGKRAPDLNSSERLAMLTDLELTSQNDS